MRLMRELGDSEMLSPKSFYGLIIDITALLALPLDVRLAGLYPSSRRMHERSKRNHWEYTKRN